MSGLLKDLLSLVLKIAFIILIFILLFTFLFGILRSSDPSMAPAVKDGDLVLFSRYTESGYQARDAIVVERDGRKEIRRVIATEGDVVDITEDGLMINGSLQQEQEIYQQTDRFVGGPEFPLTVPSGELFVLGDSRRAATDSRIYGCVKIEDTSGKVMSVIRRRGI